MSRENERKPESCYTFFTGQEVKIKSSFLKKLETPSKKGKIPPKPKAVITENHVFEAQVDGLSLIETIKRTLTVTGKNMFVVGDVIFVSADQCSCHKRKHKSGKECPYNGRPLRELMGHHQMLVLQIRGADDAVEWEECWSGMYFEPA